MNKKDECFKIYNSIKSKFDEQKAYRTFEDFFGEDGFENLLNYVGNTHQHKYDLWIFQQLNKNPDFLFEDINRIHEALSLYQKNINKIENKNLFDHDFEKLENTVMVFKNKETKNKLKTLKDVITEKETIHLFQNETGKCIIPTTHRSAQFWGLGTKWCTSAKSDRQYKSYTEKGPLMIVVTNDKDNEGKQVKYQYYLGKTKTEKRNHNDKVFCETELYFSNKKHLNLIAKGIEILAEPKYLGMSNSMTDLFYYTTKHYGIERIKTEMDSYIGFFFEALIVFGTRDNSVFREIYNNKTEKEIIIDFCLRILSSLGDCEKTVRMKKFAIKFLLEENIFSEKMFFRNNTKYFSEDDYKKIKSEHIISFIEAKHSGLHFNFWNIRFDCMTDDAIDEVIQYYIGGNCKKLKYLDVNFAKKILQSKYLFDKYYKEDFFYDIDWRNELLDLLFSNLEDGTIKKEIMHENMIVVKNYILNFDPKTKFHGRFAEKITKHYPEKAKTIVDSAVYKKIMDSVSFSSEKFWIGKEYGEPNAVDRIKVNNFIENLNQFNSEEIKLIKKTISELPSQRNFQLLEAVRELEQPFEEINPFHENEDLFEYLQTLLEE